MDDDVTLGVDITIYHQCDNCARKEFEQYEVGYFTTKELFIAPPMGWMVINGEVYCEYCLEHRKPKGE